MKIYLQGEKTINDELKTLLVGNIEISNGLDNSIDIIIDSTNFPKQKKHENIKFIDENCSKSVPVISSSLCNSISEQSSVSKFPERLVGIGLYKTFSKSNLLEIAPSKITDGKILKNTENFLKSANINYTIVPDRVGLVFPRILSMLINEAAQVYAEKIASLEDIDTAMKLGTNYPFGPLEWADKIGIDLICNLLESLHRDFGEDRYKPHQLLKEIVNNKKVFYQGS
ncbi:MAG: 3-hydroxyacyl-CoA dehydrogenase family protein [Ignavibacteria bacterium]